MPFRSTVLYPNDEDIKFDIAYYLKTHMPFVEKTWTTFGLKSWEVIEYNPGPDGSKPPYAFAAVLTWDNAGQLASAWASEATKPLLADRTNYTNVFPVFISGDVTATS